MRTMKIVGPGLFLLLSFACKKDEGISPCIRIEGTWQCQSWIEDGVEIIGPTELITAAEIQFKPLIESQGDFEWNIDFLIEGSEMVIGAYVVNENCNQVTIAPKAGVPELYNFHFEGDQLVLTRTVNGVITTMKYLKE
jgi:hypothetical protein